MRVSTTARRARRADQDAASWGESLERFLGANPRPESPHIAATPRQLKGDKGRPPAPQPRVSEHPWAKISGAEIRRRMKYRIAARYSRAPPRARRETRGRSRRSRRRG